MVPDAAPVQVIVWALEIHVSFLDIIVYILYYIWRQGDADGKGIQCMEHMTNQHPWMAGSYGQKK